MCILQAFFLTILQKTNRYILYLLYFILLSAHIKSTIIVLMNDTKV